MHACTSRCGTLLIPVLGQAAYPSNVTEDDGGTGGVDRSSPAPLRQRPAPGALDDRDEPSPEDDWSIDDLEDWPFADPSVDVARLWESLIESEADIAAGRTFGEDEIRTDYGLPRK